MITYQRMATREFGGKFLLTEVIEEMFVEAYHLIASDRLCTRERTTVAIRIRYIEVFSCHALVFEERKFTEISLDKGLDYKSVLVSVEGKKWLVPICPLVYKAILRQKVDVPAGARKALYEMGP
jgi:hypothetical protein